MSAKEDLQKKIQSLEDQLEAATESLNKILIAEYPFQPGSVVVCYRQKFTVSRLGVRYGDVCVWGRRTLKDGSLGKLESELYGKVEPI